MFWILCKWFSFPHGFALCNFKNKSFKFSHFFCGISNLNIFSNLTYHIWYIAMKMSYCIWASKIYIYNRYEREEKNWPEDLKQLLFALNFDMVFYFLSLFFFHLASSHTRISCQKKPAHQLFMRLSFLLWKSCQ